MKQEQVVEMKLKSEKSCPFVQNPVIIRLDFLGIGRGMYYAKYYGGWGGMV